MLDHLIQMVGVAHPLRSYLKLIYDITTGLPADLAMKGLRSWQQDKYQHSCLCFAIAIMYIAFLTGMALVFAPAFKIVMMAKLATSPAIGYVVTIICKAVIIGFKAVVRKIFGKIVAAIDRKFP
ncbi:hypothetical protein C1N63_12955 [Pantoea ananatis]|uniref:hypothetical protein n=1 Tax=Pantoea ananas TaxID=553 RepID=UPI000D72DECB|nr:hypothetical protein [Pantoea ananatis]AWQ19659.1 hypothetical protein C1N63_12955 [Pantoea ananatis]